MITYGYASLHYYLLQAFSFHLKNSYKLEYFKNVNILEYFIIIW